MKKIKLGRSDLTVSPIGLGTARLPPIGWAMGDEIRNSDSLEADQVIHRALAQGINFFETADVYGNGFCERALGRALKSGPSRDQLVLCTKFGLENPSFQELSIRQKFDYIETACANSLKRLQTDYIDLYLLHIQGIPKADAQGIMGFLEELVKQGKIRWYGWATNNLEDARIINDGKHCAALECTLNIFQANQEIAHFCKCNQLGIIVNKPLFMGLLTDSFNYTLKNDRRRHKLANENPVKLKSILKMVKTIFIDEERTMVQGALGWIWAWFSEAVPIPGCRTFSQVDEIAMAGRLGSISENCKRTIQLLINNHIKTA